MIAAAILIAIGLAGCSDDGAPALAHWTCPAGWVETDRGGCGPAVILCGPRGGARPGACDGLDLTHADPTRGGFALAPDGTITGAWPEGDGTIEAPPAADWMPDLGSDPCAPGWVARPDGL